MLDLESAAVKPNPNMARAAVSPWTAGRVAMLAKLWADGMSAVDIAAQLGGGLTKRAVIGRAHRDGMTRVTELTFWTDADVAALTLYCSQGLTFDEIAANLTRRSDSGAPLTSGAVRFKAWKLGLHKPSKREGRPTQSVPRIGKTHKLPPTPIVDLEIPVEQRKSLMEMGMNDCRWPVGHPGTPEFFFCGGAKMESGPYCAGHHARAYGYVKPEQRTHARTFF